MSVTRTAPASEVVFAKGDLAALRACLRRALRRPLGPETRKRLAYALEVFDGHREGCVVETLRRDT